MQLDIIICTFNRHQQLSRLLESVLAASKPRELDYLVTVADNLSSDDTAAVAQRFAARFEGRLRYVYADAGRGKAFALNQALASTSREIVAMLDDDEEVSSQWFRVVYDTLSDPAIDFIGGGYDPVWEVPPPAWVNHFQTRGAIGWIDFGPVTRQFGEPNFDAMLIGGNAVVRRACFETVGPYEERLGRTHDRLLGGEDTEMYLRLLSAGFRGLYLPELAVKHYIPESRLSKSYMRKWAYWTAYSEESIRTAESASAPRWFGLPRYRFGQAARSPWYWLKAVLQANSAEAFHHELNLWRFAGRWRFARQNL